MRHLPFALWATVLLFASAGCAKHPCISEAESVCHPSVKVEVVAVIDGDTIDVDPPVDVGPDGEVDRFRLLCIDTPETGECGYDEARDHLDDLIGGETVTLYFDSECVGVYGRGLAHVMHGGQLINLKLAQDGYALPIESYFADHACCDKVISATEAAADDGEGSWGSCGEEPWL